MNILNLKKNDFLPLKNFKLLRHIKENSTNCHYNFCLITHPSPPGARKPRYATVYELLHVNAYHMWMVTIREQSRVSVIHVM